MEQQKNLSQNPNKNKLLLGKICIFFAFPVTATVIWTNQERIKLTKHERVEEVNKERRMLKNFKIEITQGWLFNKDKYIQRDVPLTEEELDNIYQNKKPC